MIIAGVDLGTARTKAAVIDEFGRPQIVPNQRGDLYTPSVVYFENGRTPIVGVEAVAEGFIYPEHVHSHFKRLMGSSDVLYTDASGKAYTAADLSSVMLSSVKTDVEERFNGQVDAAVITVPANFKDQQKQVTIDAAEGAGLQVLKLLHEPTAAGIAYALEKKKDQVFVVFDLGGGTFDASVLQTAGDRVTVLNSLGLERLGGADFNLRIEQQVVERFAKEHGYTPTGEEDAAFFQELAEKVENAKVSLSKTSKTKIVVGYRGNQTIVEVTRSDFESWTKDLVGQTVDCATTAVSEAGLVWTDVNSIILVGGAVRMPLVTAALAEHTGITPHCDIEPDRAVAFGAALQCALEHSKGGKTLMVGGRAIPTPQAFVQEVTVHSVGCCVVDKDSELRNAVILPKGTPIPAKKVDRFSLVHEDQPEARIEILQGDEGEPREKCLSIGEIVLRDLPPEHTKTKRIEVTYMIDGNGMIKAVARDCVGGSVAEINIDYRIGTRPNTTHSAA